MLPTYIAQELLRRLSTERMRSLTRALGLDAEQRLPDLQPRFHIERALTGSIDFNMSISALGECLSVPCRLSFTADLADDTDEQTGAPIRVLGAAQQQLHALCATGEDVPVFEWRPFDQRLLPPSALSTLDEQVEELARAMEAGRPE